MDPVWINDNSHGPLANNYGQSFNQIHMVKGELLHNMGYRGEGMVIALLDAGFFNANTLPAFDSLRLNNQVLGTRDFVVPGNNVYAEHPHGMEVLSIIGGNIPGQLVGTAPKARFWLLRTEDANSEFIIEEYNWVSGAEFADSAGVDVINSSLGYTTFDDSTQNHSCNDMTGNTTPASKGANIAVSKGMIVVNSAGNSGGSSWKCVGAPADGFAVFAVGAVDSLGNYATFSSVGKVNDHVKPNITAQGKATVLSAPDGSVSRGNGTSFSSPVIAGMIACLWQAAYNVYNQLIMRAIEISSSKATQPDSLVGYGIPDFSRALARVGVKSLESNGLSVEVFPNPFKDHVTLFFSAVNERQTIEISVYDFTGRCIAIQADVMLERGENRIKFIIPGRLTSGCYILKIVGKGFSCQRKLMR